MRSRIFLVLLVSLTGVILASGLIAGVAIVRPFVSKVSERRARVVQTLAAEIEESSRPNLRMRRLSRALDVKVEIRKQPPLEMKKKAHYFTHGNRTYYVSRKSSLWATELELEQRSVWLVVRFPLDLMAPNRRIEIGLVLLACLASVGAWGLARWSISPLEEAAEAMQKIAGGDLSHRVVNPIGPAANAFNAMADQVEDLVEGQRDLMASMSHELRTPITRLRLQAELKNDESMLEDLFELEDLVTMMLESAKLHRGVIPLNYASFRLEEVWLEALGKVALTQVHINCKGENTVVVADQYLCTRVFINLFSNIKRYAAQGEIWLEAEDVNGEIYILIRDSGPGVSEEFISEVFNPFTREEKSRAKISGGLGLGLLLVYQIVRAHSGRARAFNHEQGGFCVEIWLPSLELNESS